MLFRSLVAELVYAMEREWAVTLEDLLQRRCMARSGRVGVRARPGRPLAGGVPRAIHVPGTTSALARWHETSASHGTHSLSRGVDRDCSRRSRWMKLAPAPRERRRKRGRVVVRDTREHDAAARPHRRGKRPGEIGQGAGEDVGHDQVVRRAADQQPMVEPGGRATAGVKLR